MRLLKSLVLSLSVALAGTAAAFAADEYTIDKAHSSVAFSVKHMVVNNVKGLFEDYSGTILYDEKDITKSSVKAVIKTASIDTGNEKRDEHLRNADFFDAQKYPEITFASKRIMKQGDGYAAVGTLTMHGVSKEVTIPFTVAGPIKDPWGNLRMGVEGGLTINRQDFGISWSKTMDSGGLVVGNDVKIELNLEATRPAAAAPAPKK